MPVAVARERVDAAVEHDFDSFFLQRGLQLACCLGVRSCRDLRPAVHDRHARAEPREDLGEFEADWARADDEQRLRHRFELEGGHMVDPLDLLDARNRRDRGAAARCNEDPVAAQLLVADPDRSWIDKRCSSAYHSITGLIQRLDPALLVAADRVLPPPRLREPDDRLGKIDATLRRVMPHVVHQLRRDDIGLRGPAGHVGTGSAPEPVLDQRHPGAVFSRCLSGAVSCR